MTHPLVTVGGPTGSGKSGLAVHLARTFGGEVINCDSLQVFRHFDIGTAKLPWEQRGGIRHHLIDVVEGDEGFTAGEFTAAARSILGEITGRGNLPIVAGGTGFYLRALLDGLSPVPPPSDALRKRLTAREARRPGSLHRILARLDPASGQRIHPRDLAKVTRALEIRIQSRAPASAQPPREPLAGYRVLRLGIFPPRDRLYAMLDRRCEQMLTGGLLDEIERLLAAGISAEAKPFQALGYKEGLAVLQGRMTPAAALEQMQRDTRRYAKRQYTWFRHEPGLTPLVGFGDESAVELESVRLVRTLIDSQ